MQPSSENDTSAQAGALLRLLREPGTAEDMGDAARKRVAADYTWTPNLARLDALLD